MKIPFKVSARTARLIGRENIANSEAAIIELVKNSYDADASMCIIGIDDQDIDDITIYLVDNGTGMDSEIIKTHWMTIGTNNKLYDFETAKGRIQSGAKGIGRFSLDKLGDKCSMYTKLKGEQNGLLWTVDWSTFEDIENQTLDKVTAELDAIESLSLHDTLSRLSLPNEFLDLCKNLSNGTLFIVKSPRNEWATEEIGKLFTSLEALSPPDINGFETFLYQFSDTKNFGKVYPSLCQDYDYKLHAKSVNQQVTITITRNEHDIDKIPVEFFERQNMQQPPYTKESFLKKTFQLPVSNISTFVSGFKEKFGKELLEALGDFELTLYFLKQSSSKQDRQKYYFKEVNSAHRKKWLKDYHGIKLFRDDFRVRPYGEQGSARDWLGLSLRTSAAMSRKGQYKVQSNNIAGSILISRLTNLDFEDKSSREGLQDSPTFKLFRNVILGILKELENDRSYIASELNDYYNETHKTERIKQEAEKAAEKITSKSKDKSSEYYTIEEKLAFAVKQQKVEIEELIDEKRLLASFASIGILSSSFAHELTSLERKLVNRFDTMEELISPFISNEILQDVDDFLNPYIYLEENKEADEKIKNWLKFTLESVKKDKRKRRKLILNHYFFSVQHSWKKVCKDRDISFNLDMPKKEIYLKGFEMDFDTIFNNLIVNSIDAFQRRKLPQRRELNIELQLQGNNISIQYKDTGPGLSNDIRNAEDIFEAQFSTKVNKEGEVIGTGLGMWLVKNTAQEYNAKVSILAVKKITGFSLEILIPRSGHTS